MESFCFDMSYSLVLCVFHKNAWILQTFQGEYVVRIL